MNRFHFISGLSIEAIENEKLIKYFHRFEEINFSDHMKDPIEFERLVMDIVKETHPVGEEEILSLVRAKVATSSGSEQLRQALISLFAKMGFIEKTPAEKKLQQGPS